MAKQFDIVVHGATGFTGRLVVEYLLARYPRGGSGSPIKWAMGGRSADKLAAVRDELGAPADTPLVVTDSTDAASLRALVDCTRLVLTTVGPYQLFGSELVAACAASGTDYVDLCGEPLWMRLMIDAHEAAAKASGARIVFSCGFDSVPFDLGVFMAQREMHTRYGSVANRVRGRVRKMKGTARVACSERSASSKAKPSMMGILMSQITTSGISDCAKCKPARPSGAPKASKPSARKIRKILLRIMSSSSTTKTRAMPLPRNDCPSYSLIFTYCVLHAAFRQKAQLAPHPDRARA